MEESHRKVLQKWRLKISRNINVRKVTEELFSGVILDDNDREEILAQTTTQYKALRLLDLLPRRGSQAFPAFRQALRSSGCGSIANAIQLELGRRELFDLCTQIMSSARDRAWKCFDHSPPTSNQEGDKKRLRSLIIH